MNLHNFAIRHHQSDHFKIFFGTFGHCFLTTEIEAIKKWCAENCNFDNEILFTTSFYTTHGYKDVTLFGFVDETDAMAFKLVWDDDNIENIHQS